jgi:hypothetical protein
MLIDIGSYVRNYGINTTQARQTWSLFELTMTTSSIASSMPSCSSQHSITSQRNFLGSLSDRERLAALNAAVGSLPSATLELTAFAGRPRRPLPGQSQREMLRQAIMLALELTESDFASFGEQR